MASRGEQKQRARVEHEAAEQADQRRAARRRRLYGLGAAIAVAAIVVIVAIAVSSGGGSSTPATTGPSARGDVAAVTSLLRGIPQSGKRLGAASAPVTVDYYGDLQCPICRDFTLAGLEQLISNEVRSGAAKLQYRAFQTATPDQATFAEQQAAALAAGEQRRMWNYVETFYRQQGEEGTGYVTGPFLQRIAEQVPGLDLAAWQRSRDDAALTREVAADQREAIRVGATGTPTLIIKGPKGTRARSGNVPYSDITADIRAVSG